VRDYRSAVVSLRLLARSVISAFVSVVVVVVVRFGVKPFRMQAF